MICKCLIICNIYFKAPRPNVTKLNTKDTKKRYSNMDWQEPVVDATYLAVKTFVNYLFICAVVIVV